ncbi:phage tail protein [Salmonella bongori]|uniref:Phage tail protein n=1 Tax=Salmonella enterica subsp. enterica serovar Lattenkamp TaxID=2564671 RepID=A0A5W2LYA1_SALET|nr:MULTISPECIES: phage tail sheath subtilisin-like domain-containing protein [Salmonella]EAA7137225.1 phage tail protein [Salmonella enterica]EBM0713054.1 phage tail protein [Salmonella enterica subsp. enterica serovar Agona]EBQ8819752.1 phage tail protein [Salmonella enterica subsp. enterica serovar Kisarawe]EBQ9602667.1 phage tail protein [Salmonella enterica subsp. enterica serovar Carmel]EBR9059596.1 phage tail protein [Salmonella enterica subsp. enterica serovar Koketime]EBW3736398.1 pha
MIGFDEIQNDNLIPLAQVEFNNSAAVMGIPAQHQTVLMFGQAAMKSDRVDGVGELHTPVRITRDSQAAELWGRGSMIALMVREFIAINPDAELYAIAQGNGQGDATFCGVTLGGTATESGVLSIYVGGRRYQVTVTRGQKGVEVATRLTTLINADGEAPFTASPTAPAGQSAAQDSDSGSVYLSAKFIGACSYHDVRLNYYDGETTPEGLISILLSPGSTATNPDITRSVANMGERQYNYVVMPYKDTANLNVLSTELLKRWGPVKMSDGAVWMAHTGTQGEITAFGESRNDFLFTCSAIPKAPEPDYIWAASICATCAPSLAIDPARPLQTLAVPSRMAPQLADRLTREERNLLLHGGIATVTVAAGDVVQIERQVTMYRVNKYGDVDPSYLDIETIYTLSYLRYSLRTFVTQRFPRHKLADDDTPVAPGQPIVTPKIMSLQLIALGEEWVDKGLVENLDTFKKNLLVERNTSNRNRLDVLCTPDLVNQFRFFAAQIRFIL